MSERAATADITEARAAAPQAGEATAPQAGEPELTGADLLVEEVSIDGMCGVY